MKRHSALVLSFLLIPALSGAQPQPVGKIGLYIDELRSTNEVETPGTFTAYVFCMPSSNGMMCAEYSVALPTGLVMFNVTSHPDVSVALGSLTGGMSVCFIDCREDWVWTHQFGVLAQTGDPAEIVLKRHPLAGGLVFANCLPDFPLENVFISSKVCLNKTCPPDADPPFPTAMTTADGRRCLLVFNEEVFEPDAELLSNYYVFRRDDPSDSIAVDKASLAGPDYASVNLRLEEGVEENAVYDLRIRNVRDIAGNAAIDGTVISFIGVDEEPPDLVSVTALNDTSVLVQYSERVAEASAENVSNYAIAPGPSTAYFPIGSAGLSPGGSAVLLTLSGELEQNRTYNLTVAGITDLGGNIIDFSGPIGFTAVDRTPPQVAGVEAVDSRAVRVTFNEEVTAESATMIQNYSIYPAGSPDSLLAINNIRKDSAAQVTLALSDSLEIEALYFINIAGIEDMNGLVIGAPGVTMPLTLEDVTRPTLVSAEAVNDTILELIFSEPMDTATTNDESRYSVFRTGDQSDEISVTGARPAGGGAAATLELGSPIRHGTYYTVRAANVMDAAGNLITAQNSAQIYIPDTDVPFMVSVTLRSMSALEVYFSEPLAESSAADRENYNIVRPGDPAETIVMISAALNSDGTRVTLQFTPTLEDGGQYALYANDIVDMHGNVIAAGSSMGFVADDLWPPIIVHAMVVEPNVAVLGFSEPLDEGSAENAGNYTLFERDNPLVGIDVNAAFLEGNAVTLSLAGDMAYGAPYVLEVAGVMDLAGNSVATGTRVELARVSAQPDPVITLFTDMEHSGVSIEPQPYTIFDCYVWCLPSAKGMMCAEYALENLYGTDDFSCMVLGETPNQGIVSVSIGSVLYGISECFSECQYDWVWIMKVRYFYISGRGYISVCPDPAVGSILAANCRSGYPIEPALTGAPLLVNIEYIMTMLSGFDAVFRDGAIEVSWELHDGSEIPDFTICRMGTSDASFVEIPGAGIVREQMKFTFADRELDGGESYRYRVEYSDGPERRILFETEAVQTPLMPLALRQNRPNPFNPSTVISFYLPEAGRVTLEVFDVTGHSVAVLSDCAMGRGEHLVEWDGRNGSGDAVSSGIYFYRLTAGKDKISRKMVLIR